MPLVINPSGAASAWRWVESCGHPGAGEGGWGLLCWYIYIGEEDQRWRTQLTESIYMTALLGSSVTDDDEGLGVKSCFSETEERARGRESPSSVEMGWTYKVYTKQKWELWRGGENCQQSRIKAQLWITSLPVSSLKWPHGDTPVSHHAVMMMPLFNFTFCICQIATPCFIIHEEEGPRTQGGLRDWSLPTLLFKGFNNETLKKTRNSQQCWSYCVIPNVSVINLHSFNVQRGRCLWL